MSTTLTLDAAESAFFELQLTAIKQRTYDREYPEFKGRQVLPVDYSVPAGAQTVAYDQYDRVGVAKIISSYADDLPRADVKGKRFYSPVKEIGDAFGYSLSEIESARMAGVPLEQRKANAARQACESLLDTIAFNGDADNNLSGLLSLANANVYTLANGSGAGATKAWSTKTNTEKLADLIGVASVSTSLTNGVEVPDTMLLPQTQFDDISMCQLSAGVAETVLSYFLRTNGRIKQVLPVPKLKGAGAAGADRMVCYKKDPDKIYLVIPLEFQQLPYQPKNLEFVTPCRMKTGGVICPYPMSVTYADGL